MNEKIAIITCLVNCACIALLINNSRQAKKINQNDLLKNDQSKQKNDVISHNDLQYNILYDHFTEITTDTEVSKEIIVERTNEAKKYMELIKHVSFDKTQGGLFGLKFYLSKMEKMIYQRPQGKILNQKKYILDKNQYAVLFPENSQNVQKFLSNILIFKSEKPFGILNLWGDFTYCSDDYKIIIAINYDLVFIYIMQYMYPKLDMVDIIKMFIFSKMIFNFRQATELMITRATEFCESVKQNGYQVDLSVLKQIGSLLSSKFCGRDEKPITVLPNQYCIKQLIINIYNDIADYCITHSIPYKTVDCDEDEKFCIAFEELHDVWKIAMEQRLFEDAKKLYDNLYAKCF